MKNYYEEILNNIKKCSLERLATVLVVSSEALRLNEGCCNETMAYITKVANSDKIVYTTKEELTNDFIKILPKVKEDKLNDFAIQKLFNYLNALGLLEYEISNVTIPIDYIIDEVVIKIDFILLKKGKQIKEYHREHISIDEYLKLTE